MRGAVFGDLKEHKYRNLVCLAASNLKNVNIGMDGKCSSDDVFQHYYQRGLSDWRPHYASFSDLLQSEAAMMY